MRAIILAAGRGSRMNDLTADRPKCLVTLHGRTLLDRQLAALRGAGIDEVGIVTGYRRQMLAGRGLVEFHNERWASTNMVASLACAASWLEAAPCIVSYSDIFYGSDAIAMLMASDASLAITFDPLWRDLWSRRFADPLSDAETFRLNGNGMLREIGGRPTTYAEVEGQYMGLLRLTPAAWDEIVRLRRDLAGDLRDRMHMTATLQALLQRRTVPITALAYRGSWGEVDAADDLAVYEHDGAPLSPAVHLSQENSIP